jgi:murein DD-endopeptidase MepM/ murein hydrolase activator NlpD
MITLLVAALVFSANQGSAVQVSFPHEPGIIAVEVRWKGKSVPAFRIKDQWMTILGVDLDDTPGEHEAGLLLQTESGTIGRRDFIVDVVEKKYPMTELKVAEKYVELSKADLARANRESAETERLYGVITNEMLADGPFTSPIPGRIGTNFGHRRIFNGEPRAPHAGADLRARTGTPVHAANRGRVVLAKNLFFTGNTVILDHGLGIYSLYAHLSRIDVKRGDVVRNGQLLGLSGATGRVTGPHLHWGVRVQGARVDPFTLVEIGATGK